MADLPGAVTDTTALLFFASGSNVLGKRAAAHFAQSEQQQALIYVPAVVIWKVSVLARSGRVSLRRSVGGFFGDLFSNPAFQPVELAPAHVYAADEMRFTRDPFDALICATAQALQLPLMTSDAAIRAAGVVQILW